MQKVLFLVFIFLSVLHSNINKPKHILVLHSYNESMSWVKNMNEAIYDTLEPNKNNYIMHHENMDTKRIYNNDYLKKLKQLYITKYKNLKIELILATDNNAFDFLRENRDEIFGNVPVSFSGVNFFKESDLDGYENFTGVAEFFDAKSTLELALKLYPNTKKIFVINDYLNTGRAWDKTIKMQLKDFTSNVEIEYSANLSMEELTTKIANLNKGTLVLLGVYFKDKEEKYFTYEKVGKLISDSSKNPVFCLLEFNLVEGVVGGNVIGGYYQAKAMSEIANRILNGEKASDIPILKESANRFVFDYHVLDKHNIDLSLLPENSTIIHKPIGFYQEHKSIILIATSIILFLLFIIIILLVNRGKRLEAQIKLEKLVNDRTQSLKEQKDTFEKLFYDTSDAVLLLHDKKIIDINKSALDLFKFVSKDKMLNIHPSDISPRLQYDGIDSLKKSDEMLNICIENGVNRFEWLHKRSDGEIFWASVSLTLINLNGKNVVHALVRDISIEKEHSLIVDKKNKMLEKVQHIAHLGSWELDVKTNSLIWSDEVYIIFGVQPQSLKATYEAFLSFIHPEDIYKVNEAYQNSIEQKSDYQIRHRIVRKDGIIRYVNESAYHQFDNNNNVIKSIGTVHDITDMVIYEIELERLKNELEGILEYIPSVVYRCEIDESWTMLYLNHAIYNLTGYEIDDFILNKIRTFNSIIYKDDRKMIADTIREAINNNSTYELDYRLVNSNNDIVWVHEHGQKIIDGDNNEILEGIISDITSKKEIFDKLKKFIDIQDSIVILTDGNKLNFANKKFFDFFEYNNIEDFNEDYSCICNRFNRSDGFFTSSDIKTGESTWIDSILNLSGRQRVVSMADSHSINYAFIVSINSYDKDNYVVNFSDISDSMVEKLQLKNQVIHDELTGSYNRAYFKTNISHLIEDNMNNDLKTGVIFFDIDYFKNINDTYGHKVGDDVLKSVVEVVTKHIRHNDKLIRWGGEEFLVITSTKSIDSLYFVAEQLRLMIENYKFKDIESLTCSFGVSLNKEGEDIYETVKIADDKLYKAKANGRNIVIK